MKLLDYLLAFLILGALAGATLLLRQEPRELAGVARVVDGDTLAFGETRVRLLDIDAPELAQECGLADKAYPCGLRAQAALRRLAGGRHVTCRADGRDRYGRDLARCDLSGTDIGGAMVDEGWAVSLGSRYAADEARARAAARGIWAAPFERPADWRRAHPH